MTGPDSLPLARDLIRCPSVTPKDEGALAVLERFLTRAGFACTRLPFGEGAERIENLWAIAGQGGPGRPHLSFAGHTDVVPVGDKAGWTVDPFGAEVADGMLYGRGAADMKSAIAAFAVAAAARLAQGPLDGRISLLITGDEEGRAIHGTKPVVDWLKARPDLIPDCCVVGEPTNPQALGEMIKIGRRGSLNGRLIVTGVQGHVAYPHLADNPVPRLLRLLASLDALVLDSGYDHFQASNLEITTMDVGNSATNVIPARAMAGFNIRFNPGHTGKSLEALLCRTLDQAAEKDATRYDLEIEVSGEAFLTREGPFTKLLAEAVTAVTGKVPELSTTGGTSDARFIKDICPVAEFGLVGQTMHKTDERTSVADLAALETIYAKVIEGFFA